MKIPLKLDYACRVLIQLIPTHGTDEVARIEDLADREAVSPTYLVQVLNDLRNAGLVVSRRGKLGGFALARAPRSITLEDILLAVEGPFLEPPSAKPGESGARTADLWRRLASRLREFARQTTLEDVARGDGPAMYYI